jgi:sulfide:quinone oxidoreductase
MEQISFPLKRPLASQGIGFVHGSASHIDADRQRVHVGDAVLEYDFLVIATGHRSANEAVPGLGPFVGPGHSLMSPPETEEARKAWTKFLDDPGPVVVGCAAGASCLGPAYEFAFEIDHALKKRKMRHRVPITFVTPEPYLGHFGVGGMGGARQFLEGEFERRDIKYHTSVAVSKITDSSGAIGGEQIARYAHHPPLCVNAISDSPWLGNPKGFVQVDESYRHKTFDNVYAVGVAVAYPPVDETPVPVNFPKTGHMTVQMAKAAARNIAVDLQGGERVTRPPFVHCILDMGDTAAHKRIS